MLVLMLTASGRGVDEAAGQTHHWRQVNFSSCITGLDTGATCDLATFPSSPANIIRDVKYCCNNPLSFQEWGVCGVCGGGGDQYNVPVCHSITSALNGQLRGNVLLSQFLVTSSCRRSRQVP